MSRTKAFGAVLTCTILCGGGWFAVRPIYAEIKMANLFLEDLPFELGMTRKQAEKAAVEPFYIQPCPPDDLPGRSFPSYCYWVHKDFVYVGGIDFANNGPLSDIHLQTANVDDHEAWVYTKALVDALDRLAEAGDGEIVVKLDRKPIRAPDNRHVKFSSGQRSVAITVIDIDPNHKRVILTEKLSTNQ